MRDQIKWDEKYRSRGDADILPSPFLCSLDPILPKKGRALDLAGGRGRNGVWLAQRGLNTTVADISPVGLALAQEHARAQGTSIETAQIDLSRALPADEWDVITSFYYLQRPLFDWFPEHLRPGGLLVFAQQTRKNLERNKHPSLRFLLEDGELPMLIKGLEVLSYEEKWMENGLHEARLVAQKK